jgi:zinc protease
VIFSLEPVGGFGGRAAHLNDYHWERGDPGYLEKDLERFRALTPADVRTAAMAWLANDRRVALTVTPRVLAPVPAAPSPAKEAR